MKTVSNLGGASPRLLGIFLSLWIVGLGSLIFVWNLGNVGLVDETEPLFAEAARQMLVRHDWVTPYFNEVQRFDKPPLIYWLMAIGYQILGVNEWAARLPSALSAIGLMGLVGYTLWHHGRGNDRSLGEKFSAFLGPMILALCPEMWAWGRVGVSDMLLNATMGSTLLCFFNGYAAGDGPIASTPRWFSVQNRWYFAAYACCALAILTKGPVGLVLPGAIVLLFLAYTGQWKMLRELHIPLGFLWTALLSVPWFVLVIQANGEAYINAFFGYHNFDRFIEVVNHHSAPPYFYFLVVAVGFGPWSLHLIPAFHRLRLGQWQRWRSIPRSRHLGLFAAAWFVGIFGFFTIAVTKLPSYVLPLMPAAAILIALHWSDGLSPHCAVDDRVVNGGDSAIDSSLETQPPAISKTEDSSPNGSSRQSSRRSFPLWSILNSGFFLMLSGLMLFPNFWLQGIRDPAMPSFAQDLATSGILPWGGSITLATAIGLGIFSFRQNTKGMIWGNFLGMVLLFSVTMMPTILLVDQHRQEPLRHLAQTLAAVHHPREPIVMVALEKPSLVFYSHQPIYFFRQVDSALDFIQQLSSLSGTTVPNTAIASPQAPDAVQSPTVLLITYRRGLQHFGLDPAAVTPLSQPDPYLLIRTPLNAFPAQPPNP